MVISHTLGIEEAAKVLGCTQNTLRVWVSKRRVPVGLPAVLSGPSNERVCGQVAYMRNTPFTHARDTAIRFRELHPR